MRVFLLTFLCIIFVFVFYLILIRQPVIFEQKAISSVPVAASSTLLGHDTTKVYDQ